MEHLDRKMVSYLTLKRRLLFVSRRLIHYSLFTIYCSLLAGCSLPRIIVLEDPLSPEEHLNLGVAYEKNGELDSAAKEYEAASKKLPLAHLYLGNVCFQKNELDEAEKYYRKAMEEMPGNADVYNNLAWLFYTKKENLDEAEGLALKAMAIEPAKQQIYQDTLEKIRALKVSPLR
jgi:Tfp pilus assembly protein PilF